MSQDTPVVEAQVPSEVPTLSTRQLVRARQMLSVQHLLAAVLITERGAEFAKHKTMKTIGNAICDAVMQHPRNAELVAKFSRVHGRNVPKTRPMLHHSMTRVLFELFAPTVAIPPAQRRHKPAEKAITREEFEKFEKMYEALQKAGVVKPIDGVTQ